MSEIMHAGVISAHAYMLLLCASGICEAHFVLLTCNRKLLHMATIALTWFVGLTAQQHMCAVLMLFRCCRPTKAGTLLSWEAATCSVYVQQRMINLQSDGSGSSSSGVIGRQLCSTVFEMQ